MDDVAVREALPEEATLLADLGRRTFIEAFGAENDPGHLARFLESAYHPELQARELADPSLTTFLALAAGAPAGFAQLRRGPAEPCIAGPAPVELQRIYVLQAFHGRGAGAALLKAVIDRARGEGFLTLWLGVWERNQQALAFYRRWGFCESGSHVFDVGGDPQRDLLLERPLESP